MQENLGVVPPIFLSSYRQVTSCIGANAPGSSGPRRTSIEGTSTWCQICARRRYARRSSGVRLLSEWDFSTRAAAAREAATASATAASVAAGDARIMQCKLPRPAVESAGGPR